MRYRLSLAALAFASLAGSQPSLANPDVAACDTASARCVWRCADKQPPGSQELYACFRDCERVFQHCLNTLPPVWDLEADPGKRKTPKKKKPGNASQSGTVIE